MKTCLFNIATCQFCLITLSFSGFAVLLLLCSLSAFSCGTGCSFCSLPPWNRSRFNASKSTFFEWRTVFKDFIKSWCFNISWFFSSYFFTSFWFVFVRFSIVCFSESIDAFMLSNWFAVSSKCILKVAIRRLTRRDIDSGNVDNFPFNCSTIESNWA